jgi:hypothetical protein
MWHVWGRGEMCTGKQLYYGNACRVLVGNPAGEKTLVRSRNRWEDNIKWI